LLQSILNLTFIHFLFLAFCTTLSIRMPKVGSFAQNNFYTAYFRTHVSVIDHQNNISIRAGQIGVTLTERYFIMTTVNHPELLHPYIVRKHFTRFTFKKQKRRSERDARTIKETVFTTELIFNLHLPFY